jgi:TonB family protein
MRKSVIDLLVEYRSAEALPLAQKALALRERLLAPNDPRIEQSLEDLGSVYYANKNYKSARGPLERALKLREARVGIDNSALISILDRLAICYFQNRDEKAETVFQRSIKIKEKQFGSDHINLAPSLVNLANFYRWQRDLKHGIPAFQRALEVLYKHSGTNSPDFIQANTNFLCMGYENSQGRLPEEFHLLTKRFAAAAADPDIFEVLNGKAISLPRPSYPAEARNLGQYGAVVIRVSIDETGTVYDAHSMCGGWPVLAQAAIQSAWKARFTPTYINGQAAKVSGVITYNFVYK